MCGLSLKFRTAGWQQPPFLCRPCCDSLGAECFKSIYAGTVLSLSGWNCYSAYQCTITFWAVVQVCYSYGWFLGGGGVYPRIFKLFKYHIELFCLSFFGNWGGCVVYLTMERQSLLGDNEGSWCAVFYWDWCTLFKPTQVNFITLILIDILPFIHAVL